MTITEHYLSYVSEHGKKPATVSSFCKIAGISETDFYSQYTSFIALEDHIWKEWMMEIINKITTSETYTNYTIREKYLAFCFGLTQELIKVRSFVTWRFSSQRMREIHAFYRFRNVVKEHLESLISEGEDTGEIPSRFGINRIYSNAGWLHIQSVIKFWITDTSDGFENTDIFIEKSSNFQMDLISRNGLDSGAEFGKFIFQQLWK